MNKIPPKSNGILAMYFAFKALPALGGILSVCLGYRLFILGVTGQASLSVNSTTVQEQLLNAAPGLFFALGGIATLLTVVWKGVDVTFDPKSRLGILAKRSYPSSTRQTTLDQ